MAEPEPISVLIQLFVFGIFSAVPLLLLRNFLDSNNLTSQIPNWLTWLTSPLTLIILFALLEETLKDLALIGGVELNRNRFDKWEDGFEFAVLIALGFAFTENILYFITEYLAGGISPTLWSSYLFRSLGTVLGHIIFTGTFGYYYACAYVLPHLVPSTKHEKPLANFFSNLWTVVCRPFHITFSHLLPRRDSARGHPSGEVVIEGFLLVILLHSGFNALLFFTPAGQNLTFLTVPLLIGGGWWYGRRWKNKA